MSPIAILGIVIGMGISIPFIPSNDPPIYQYILLSIGITIEIVFIGLVLRKALYYRNKT